MKPKFRSRLEERIARQIKDNGLKVIYEKHKLTYEVPARKAKYTPDFDLGPFLLEAKGFFRTAADRQKLVLVKQQNPDLDLRILFQNSNLPIYKGSNTSYGEWASSNGFKWADKGEIPRQWLNEAKQHSQTSSI